MSLENLTQLQKIAIEGMIANVYATCPHEEEVLYKYYAMLRGIREELKPFVVELTREYTDIDQDLLNRVFLEATLGVVPEWLWVDRIVADLKLSIKLCDNSMVEPPFSKRKLMKKTLTSAFVALCHNAMVPFPNAVIMLCRRVQEEYKDLGFLEEACFNVLQRVEEDETKVATPELMLIQVDIKSQLLIYEEETLIAKGEIKRGELTPEQLAERINKVVEKDRASKEPSRDERKEKLAKSMGVSKETLENILKEGEGKAPESIKYIVMKRYIGSGIQTALRVFNTEQEAEKFVENMKQQFPDLEKTCNLIVEEGIISGRD